VENRDRYYVIRYN